MSVSVNPLVKKEFKHCASCADRVRLPIDFSMAFQPIVNVETGETFAQEALVRGLNGEGAQHVLNQVTPEMLYRFDQKCRAKAIATAVNTGLRSKLSINFMPRAVYEPENCLSVTLAYAERYKLPLDQLIFEVSEQERLDDTAHLKYIIDVYHAHDLSVAFDDFGVDQLGLDSLVKYQPKLVKLDRFFIDHIDQQKRKHTIAKAMVQICKDLGINLIAEGIERIEEAKALRDLGIDLMQGYYFAKPEFERQPTPNKANLYEVNL